MKMNYLNKNNNIALSKRTKSGDKDKFQTIKNSKFQYNQKYMSYFNSPKKGENVLFMKKKFQKIKKNSGEKIKSEIINNINNSNNNISSSYINFMSPINKNYCNKKQNYGLTKFLKNQLILNSVDTSSYAKSKEKDKDKEKVLSYNSNENINNKKINKDNALNGINNKNTPDLLYHNYNQSKVENNKKQNNKNFNMKLGKNSFKFNFLNNLSSTGNNKHFYKNKLYSIKGMINNKKNNKNISNSNQNLLSNTMFESNNKSHYHNNINFYENYIKAVALNKTNKYSINKSISTNQSNNISYPKKPNYNMTFNSNTLNGIITNRDANQTTTNNNFNNKSIYTSNMIQSPKVNISKTTKSSPKININNKRIKGHAKNKSISIITKSDVSFLFKNNNNFMKMNKMNYNNNMNYTTLNDNWNYNLYSNNGHHYKYSQILNNNKKLQLIDVESNNNIKKNKITSPYNVYHKKKTQPNSRENSFIKNKLKNKINISKNNNNNNNNNHMSNINSNSNKNIYVSKNHLSKHKNKNLTSLNNSTQMIYSNNNITNEVNINNNTQHELSSPKSQNYQKTEDIIVNNYNININNQINNTNNYITGNFIQYDSKKKNNLNNINNNNDNITLKKKKLISQSLKDILISNNKNTKIFTANNSPLNKLGILLNGQNNNYLKNNNKSSDRIDNIKYTYNKLSSNRENKKDLNKKRIFESISSRKKDENKNIKIENKNLNINLSKKNNNNIAIESQRKYLEMKKKQKEELENNKKKTSLKKEANTKDTKDSKKEKDKEKEDNNTNNNINNNNSSKNNVSNITANRNNNDVSLSLYNPTLSSRSSVSYDANYYMKESLKLANYISKYYSKNKKYPNTSLQFYKYGRLIGQGAFGKVNLGLNILTGRIVAVKSFDKNNSELTGDNMKKILYETDLMKKLNHPNITKILEMFEDEKYFMIIMEYINGGNLFSFVKKRRKLSEKTAKFLFRQIIQGIKYIHEQNIVHRDIKLENLLIDLNNNVKICDFGIGRKIKNKNQLLHDQCGTLMYMAPEILLSSKEKGYEPFPVDIWSSGISLYIMLSGTLPFNYKNKKNEDDEEEEENEEEEESFSEKSKSKKNEEDNFKLQYSIVYKEPKKIEKISGEARDLLKGLLNKDPKKRLTCEQILNHPWLNNCKEKNISAKKFHLFTKAENVMLSKTFIDYRKANYEDLKENFTLSNLENNTGKNKQNSNEENITNKSSILAPYNSIISESDDITQRISIKSNDSFDDFNNSKIKLENELIAFSKKIKEFNRLYELNNNGEVDNGVLINSKTQSSANLTDRSSSNKSKSDALNINISNFNSLLLNENNEDKKNKTNRGKNNSRKSLDEEMERHIKSNNILEQMKLMGYNRNYVLDCVKKNELCHASAVYYLMMNYENI